ncbi:NACHT domain-containing protein [Limnofasciculus baicalensis]|uniref:NACHT domain-containing protein n=1 Tax=Limnofasciculus baicalensis TaxID=3064906 RepID=UPI0020A78ED4|nr:NACHT domain-containing protein [Limnofasciculus baicalensis]
MQDEVNKKLNVFPYHGELIILKKNLHESLVKHTDLRKEPITDPDYNIFDIFNYKDGAYRKLVIVGEPGSGKTITLYELTQELIKEAKADENKPIPVVVDLCSWKKDKQSMREWLVEKLSHKYKLEKQLFINWFGERKILPLLDGLDEVKPEYQQDCVLAINKLLEEINPPQYLVVCCRIEEYESLIRNNDYSRLNFFQAIELQELTVQQIHNRLKYMKLDRIWQIIKDRGHLLKLLCTPLMLSIAIEVYTKISDRELNQFNSSAKLQPYLFNQYITIKLPHEDIPVRDRDRNIDTTRWLIWLAQNLKRRNQKEFLIEEIQPDWLPKYRIIYYIGVALILSLFSFIISILLNHIHIFNLTFVYYLVSAIIVLSIAQNPSISIVESFTWTNWSFRQVKWVWIISLFAALCLGVVNWINNGIVAGLKVTLITAIVATIVSLPTGFTGVERPRKTYANQGIIKSCKNAVIFGFCLGLISTLIGILIGILIDLRIDGLLNLLKVDAILGIIVGLMSGLFMGGITCIQHFILRLILRWNGLPWNFTLFLDYATQKGFLQGIGGSYQFMHDLLRDHFATQLPRYQNKVQ